MNSKLPNELVLNISKFFQYSDMENYSNLSSFDYYIFSPQEQQFGPNINQLFFKHCCFNDNFLDFVNSYNSLLTKKVFYLFNNEYYCFNDYYSWFESKNYNEILSKFDKIENSMNDYKDFLFNINTVNRRHVFVEHIDKLQDNFIQLDWIGLKTSFLDHFEKRKVFNEKFSYLDANDLTNFNEQIYTFIDSLSLLRFCF